MAVLIIAPSDDVHAEVLQGRLQQLNVDAIIWDLSRLPSKDTCTFHITPDSLEVGINSKPRSLKLLDISSIWWRRPTAHVIDEAVTDERVRSYCQHETRTFIRGVFGAAGVPLINDPEVEVRAERKPLQLRTAQHSGFLVPRTLMTNDPSDVRRFFDDLRGRCVYKAFGAPRWQMVETRRLTEEDLGRLDSLRHAPIIVQEYIERGRDIRVTVVGRDVFAAEAIVNDAVGDIDWRLDLTTRWQPHTLPEAISSACVVLTQTLGLMYGCIDMRQAPDGSYWFFEINPSGQFLFVEIDAGLPISIAMARLLKDPSGLVALMVSSTCV
jgi:glutathione synthase/RimK-type ligase-like ATP-grasp enzyme